MIHSTPQNPSHSRLSCLHHCSRKYWHRYIQERKEEIVTVPLHMGKVGHAGLDAYYRGDDVEIAIEKAWGAQKFYGEKDSWLTLGHMQLRLARYIAADGESWKPKLLREDKIQWENVLEHECKWDTNGNMVMAESKILINIGNDLSIVVVPDLIIEHEFDAEIGVVPVVVDHKFRVGWINDQQRTAMEVGHQLRMYALAYEALTGLRCRDGWMNNICANSNTVKPNSNAKRRQISMYEPWSHEQMQGTWDWIKSGITKAQHAEKHSEVLKLPALVAEAFPQNPGLHCHYCEFREECVGE